MKDIMNDIFSAGGAEVSIIPVVQGDGMMKIDQSQLPDSLPILALRNAVLFPGTVFPITIGREKSMRLIEDAERTNSFIGTVPQNDLSVEEPTKEDLYAYGTVAKIVKTLEMPDGTITAILQGFKRFELESVFDYEPYMLGRVKYLDDVVPENDTKMRMIAESLKEKGGHVSYYTIPSARNRGLASMGLKLCCQYAKEVLGLDEVLITCKAENVPSYKTMSKVMIETGGFEDKPAILDKEQQKRVWIRTV